MAGHAVPVIDMAPFYAGGKAAQRALAAEIDAACSETGFFCLTGTDVSEALIAATRAKAEAFFALPEAEKMRVERPPQKISRGYNPLGDRSLAYSLGLEAPPDLQEAFAFGRELAEADGAGAVEDPMLAPNLWPARPAGFRAQMLAYYETMSRLGLDVLRVMTHALGVPEDYFADSFEHASTAVRLIRYPAQRARPASGQLRAGMHTDYGAVTFVRGDDVAGGLQVRLRHGGWVDVHPPPGAFVCNIGDAMMRWTNDRWVSTLHRVANPPPDAAPCDRISLVFFHMPNHDAVIRCIPGCADADGGARHPPVTFSEHYLGKVMKAAHRRADAGMADAMAER